MQIKKGSGNVFLAPDMPGTGVLNVFYTNLTLGGYDLSGTENTGIMANIIKIIDYGMPLNSKEVMKVSFKTHNPFEEYPAGDGELLYTKTTTITINSVTYEPIYEDPLFTTNPPPEGIMDLGDIPMNNNSGNNVPASKQPCDCSCEAYEAFKEKTESMSKKDKKNVDMAETLCAKDCITKWMKCPQK